MLGSLALHRGVVYVGREAKTATIEAFDLEGRQVGEGFSFRDPRIGRSVAAGLAVDEEHRIWVADTPACRVRTFTVFGQEVGGLGLGLDKDLEGREREDRRGFVRRPVAVCVRGDADGLLLCVASSGERRHAVQLFDEAGRCLASLRPSGEPRGHFREVSAIAMQGERVLVAEREGRRVQVFQKGEFHFAFPVVDRAGRSVKPTAIAAASGGRLIVTWAGEKSGMGLLDSSGQLLCQLAEGGREEGELFQPGDVVIEEGGSDRRCRVVVIDLDGARVQVFNLEGRCYGSFC